MPVRCCDPVMKSCACCKYGLIQYDDFGGIQYAFCRFDFEDDEPYQEDIDEFNKWYNGVYKFNISEKPTE